MLLILILAMVDINATLPPVLDPLINTIKFLTNMLSVFVGGIFGIYLILIFLRWKEARDIRRLLKEIRNDLKELKGFIKKKK